MADFVHSIRLESLVNITALVKTVPKPVESCTQKDVELAIDTIFVAVSAPKVLPFQMADASRKVDPQMEVDDYQQKKQNEKKKDDEKKKNEMTKMIEKG